MAAARIMIVEDNTTVAEDCRECLEHSGFEVTSISSSGEEAVALACIEQPDAVLMDIKLRGEIDGIEAATQIHSYLDIPVIFLSAYSDNNLLQRAKQTGSFGYLIKPFDERELFTMLEMTLYKARAEKERRQMEDRLHEVRKMEAIGRLTSSISHDFNQMMHVIMGYTEFAMEQVDSAGPVYSNLEEVMKAAQQSVDLVQQLMTFARKQVIEPVVLDPNHSIERTLGMLRRLIGKHVDLVWQPADDLWPVKIDPSQLDQIMTNLCINAKDAVAGTGRILVATEMASFDEEYCAAHQDHLPGDFVLLSVQDNGRGMDKEILAKIFEPFFTTKKQGEGTGLGLATVYGIVKQNKGFILVDSKVEQGSTFDIYLPRYIEESVRLPVSDSPEKLIIPQGKETILLVEDDPAILEMTAKMLRQQGYTVLPTVLPAKAIRLAKAHAGEIDLLLTNVILPDMSGQELLKQLVSICPKLKCLYMSGYGADAISDCGVLMEPDILFIQKPFSIKELAGKVRQALDSQQHDMEQERMEKI